MPKTGSWNGSDQSHFSQSQDILTQITMKLNIPPELILQMTAMEVILGESLLKPGLQTAVRVHSYLHVLPVKNLDMFKNSTLDIVMQRKILKQFGINDTMRVNQVVYRLDNRRPINNNTEEFILHACDQTLLDDAATLVSKMWKCTKPSSVVEEVLRSCAGVDPGQLDVESCDPARDYIAENIHPFQIVAQQTNVALAAGNDPSFLHYMTYKNYGTHHFRSLNYLTKKSPIIK